MLIHFVECMGRDYSCQTLALQCICRTQVAHMYTCRLRADVLKQHPCNFSTQPSPSCKCNIQTCAGALEHIAWVSPVLALQRQSTRCHGAAHWRCSSSLSKQRRLVRKGVLTVLRRLCACLFRPHPCATVAEPVCVPRIGSRQAPRSLHSDRRTPQQKAALSHPLMCPDTSRQNTQPCPPDSLHNPWLLTQNTTALTPSRPSRLDTSQADSAGAARVWLCQRLRSKCRRWRIL